MLYIVSCVSQAYLVLFLEDDLHELQVLLEAHPRGQHHVVERAEDQDSRERVFYRREVLEEEARRGGVQDDLDEAEVLGQPAGTSSLGRMPATPSGTAILSEPDFEVVSADLLTSWPSES